MLYLYYGIYTAAKKLAVKSDQVKISFRIEPKKRPTEKHFLNFSVFGPILIVPRHFITLNRLLFLSKQFVYCFVDNKLFEKIGCSTKVKKLKLAAETLLGREACFYNGDI